jgi:hypothetical protein
VFPHHPISADVRKLLPVNALSVRGPYFMGLDFRFGRPRAETFEDAKEDQYRKNGCVAKWFRRVALNFPEEVQHSEYWRYVRPSESMWRRAATVAEAWQNRQK